MSLALLAFSWAIRSTEPALSGGIVGGLLTYWLPSQPISATKISAP